MRSPLGAHPGISQARPTLYSCRSIPHCIFAGASHTLFSREHLTLFPRFRRRRGLRAQPHGEPSWHFAGASHTLFSQGCLTLYSRWNIPHSILAGTSHTSFSEEHPTLYSRWSITHSILQEHPTLYSFRNIPHYILAGTPRTLFSQAPPTRKSRGACHSSTMVKEGCERHVSGGGSGAGAFQGLNRGWGPLWV